MAGTAQPLVPAMADTDTDKPPARLTAEEQQARMEKGVELGTYLTWVKNELDSEQACMELPFTIVLLIAFSCLSLLHLRQDYVYTVEGALRFDVQENANFAWAHNFGHKNVPDVNSIPDFWSWYRLGFLPLIVQPNWGYSESLQDGYNLVKPANMTQPYDSSNLPGNWQLSEFGSANLPTRNDVLHYNRLIGGIRLQQERGLLGYEYCRVPRTVDESTWREWLGKPCMLGTLQYELSPEVTDAEAFLNPERVEWFMMSNEDLQTLQRKAIDMEDGCSHMQDKVTPAEAASGVVRRCRCETCSEGEGDLPKPWLDERTQRVELAYVCYNAEYGLYSLVTVNYFFNRAGRIYEKVHTQSAFQNIFAGHWTEIAVMVSCDIIWVSMLSWVLYGECREIIRVVRSSKERWYKSVYFDYVSFWNVVDWISIGCAYVVVAMFLRMLAATREVNLQFEAMVEDPAGLNEASTQELFELVEAMCSVERDYRVSFMFYPMVVMMRLFKSFDAQPRLAVVTRTLVVSTKDMVHFFIIFFSVYFCLSVNGVLIFGQDVESFSTLDRAVMTCFRALFGDWDWGSMKVVGLMLAAIWFWSFVMIMIVLLLNMLLAILMESYAEVKEKASNALTLPQQVSEMVRRRRQTRNQERVRLNDIWDAFFKVIGDEKDMLESKEIVTPEDVIERVFSSLKLVVPESQANRTVGNAKKAVRPPEEPYTSENVARQLTTLVGRNNLVEDEVTMVCRLISGNDVPLDDLQEAQHAARGEVEHRKKVADTVQGVIGGLRDELKETLQKENDLFETSHKHSHAQLKDMFDVAKDAEVTLHALRDKTEKVVGVLQRHARLRRSGSAEAASLGGLVPSVGMRPLFAGCEPMMSPK